MKKETVGKQLYDKLVKEQAQEIPVLDLAQAMQENYMNELLNCVDQNHNKFVGSFYIEVLRKNEKALGTVFRDYFTPRSTCPTPMYDQDVYKYNKKDGKLDYLWSIPCEDACIYLENNAVSVDSSERMLLSYVMAFRDGSLLKACKKLNGEVLEAGVSLNK